MDAGRVRPPFFTRRRQRVSQLFGRLLGRLLDNTRRSTRRWYAVAYKLAVGPAPPDLKETSEQVMVIEAKAAPPS